MPHAHDHCNHPPGEACSADHDPPRLVPPPLSLYVHLPWCAQMPVLRFHRTRPRASAVRRDMMRAAARPRPDLPLVWGRWCVSSVAARPACSPAGGDRPLPAAGQRAPALCPQRRNHPETNPGTAEHGRFDGYRAAGVNRLSFGIQSFDDAMLKRLGQHPRQWRSRARGKDGAGRGLRQLQHRPDVLRCRNRPWPVPRPT